jgi:hypothetical protein
MDENVSRPQNLDPLLASRGEHFRFGSVFIKKNNQTEIFFLKKKPKPNRNRVKPTGFGSIRFFRAKTGSNRFGLVFSVLARFFWFGLVFSVWLGFGSVFPVWLGLTRFFFRFFVSFGSVRFFQFFGYKTETEPNRPVFSKN